MTVPEPVTTGSTGVTTDLRGRSFLKELDFTAAEFGSLIELSALLKVEKHSGLERPG